MPPGLLGPAEMETIRATKFHGAARGLERVGVAQEREGPGLNEVLAAARAGGFRAVPNSIGSPCPHPMLENIIDDMASVPGVPAADRDDPEDSTPKSQQVMQFQALPTMKEQAATPLSKSREGAARPQRPPTKMGPAGAHKRRFVHTQRPTSP